MSAALVARPRSLARRQRPQSPVAARSRAQDPQRARERGRVGRRDLPLDRFRPGARRAHREDREQRTVLPRQQADHERIAPPCRSSATAWCATWRCLTPPSRCSSATAASPCARSSPRFGSTACTPPRSRTCSRACARSSIPTTHSSPGLLHEVGKLYILMRVKDEDRAARERSRVRVGRRRVASAPRTRGDRVVGDCRRSSPSRSATIRRALLEAPEPPRLTDVVAVANYLAENSEAACADEHYFDKAPNLGSLAMDKPTFDWLIRAGDVDVRLLMIAFGI